MTFLEIQNQVLAYLNDPDANYFTRPIIKTWINRAQQELQKLVDQAFEGYFTICAQSQTVINQREYLLPPDFKKLQRLTIILSGSTFVTESQNLLSKITPNQQDVLPRSGVPQSYYFNDDLLLLVPCPNQPWPLRMEYIYRLPDMVDDDEVSPIPSQYHEYMVILPVMDGFIRDGLQTGDMEKKRQLIETAIKRDAEERNIDQPRTIVQTIFDESGDDIW